MPSWLKLLFALAGAALLILVLLVGGVTLWVNHNQDRMLEMGKTAGDDGKRFGVEHTQAECVNDAAGRIEQCGGSDVGCESSNHVRLNACISVAKSDGLCARAPLKGDMWKSAMWANDECDRRGRHASQPCQRLMQSVPEACARTSR
jgi:hypothetical protein